MSDAPSDDRNEQSSIDALVRGHLERSELELATTRTLEHYGPELFGFLRAIARDDDLAAEAFALASERMWQNLERFRWEASLRTWVYQLARNALYRLRRDPRRRASNNLPLSLVQSIEEVRRSPTEPYRRTEIKDMFRTLRESLDPLDHEILILRLDRSMSWKDIARSLADEDTTDTVEQRAAAYRKRFERAKSQLRELAVTHGLVGEPDNDN
ncbi:MAG: sigma-70 family RNA polymerase sigma factor [Kofleriaceae bacterium]